MAARRKAIIIMEVQLKIQVADEKDNQAKDQVTECGPNMDGCRS